MTDYTPDEEGIITTYADALSTCDLESYDTATAAVERGIAKIKAEALREAAEGFRHCKDYGYRATRMRATEDYLNAKADRIEGEANE